MKIAVNGFFLAKPDTGIGQVTRGFLSELSRNDSLRGNDQYLVFTDRKPSSPVPKKLVGKITPVPLYKRDDLARQFIWEKYVFPKQALREKCEAMISLYQCPTTICEIPHTMLVHDMVWKIHDRYLDNWRKRAYANDTFSAIKKATRLVAVSENSKKDMVRLLDLAQDQITVAYPSVGPEFDRQPAESELEKVRQKYSLPENYIFYIGGFDFRKNVDRLIEAFTIFKENDLKKISLVLAGADNSQKSPLFTDVKKIALECGIFEWVCFPGFVQQPDLPALYRNSLFFVFPSIYEGFGLPVLEAMKCQTPVIASLSSSISEVGGAAISYFHPEDTTEHANEMVKLSRDPEKREHMGFLGLKQAEKFTWSDFTRKLVNK